MKSEHIFDFFDFLKNPDIECVQTAVKHAKITKKIQNSIFFEKIDLDLSFGEGFDGIHQLARFLCYFEIY